MSPLFFWQPYLVFLRVLLVDLLQGLYFDWWDSAWLRGRKSNWHVKINLLIILILESKWSLFVFSRGFLDKPAGK